MKYVIYNRLNNEFVAYREDVNINDLPDHLDVTDINTWNKWKLLDLVN